MESINTKDETKYFAELSLRFAREHIESLPAEDDRLPVLLDGREIGVVIPEGAMRIRAEWIDHPEASELYHHAGAIAAEVRKYMTLIDVAAPLKAQSLDAPYKQLLDFNGYVLGGMESRYERKAEQNVWRKRKEHYTEANRSGMVLAKKYGTHQ